MAQFGGRLWVLALVATCHMARAGESNRTAAPVWNGPVCVRCGEKTLGRSAPAGQGCHLFQLARLLCSQSRQPSMGSCG